MSKPKKGFTPNPMQILLGIHLRELGLLPDYELKFDADRNWRFDVYCQEQRIAIEIHGGQFSGGHRRGWWNKKEALRRQALGLRDTPQEDEYLKLSTATMAGWRVLQFSNEQVNDGRAKEFIGRFLDA
jgi:very-short-patch-repair endonuclease